MQTLGCRNAVVLAATFAFVCSIVFVPVAQANIISTETMLHQQQHAQRVAHVRALLAQKRIAKQMVALGVDPSEVQARVASLTDEQLIKLENHLTDLPAGGGVLAVLGVVFVVLLALELVGAINLFNSV